jgi:hypothetical protein
VLLISRFPSAIDGEICNHRASVGREFFGLSLDAEFVLGVGLQPIHEIIGHLVVCVMDTHSSMYDPRELLGDDYPVVPEVVKMVGYKDEIPFSVLAHVLDPLAAVVMEAGRHALPLGVLVFLIVINVITAL